MAMSAEGANARRCARRGANTRSGICTVRGKHGLSGDGAGDRLIINLRAQRLNSKGVGKATPPANSRLGQGFGTLFVA